MPEAGLTQAGVLVGGTKADHTGEHILLVYPATRDKDMAQSMLHRKAFRDECDVLFIGFPDPRLCLTM